MNVCRLLDDMIVTVFSEDTLPTPRDVPAILADEDLREELWRILKAWERRWGRRHPYGRRKLTAVVRAYRQWHPRLPICSMYFMISQRVAYRAGLGGILPALGYKKRIVAVHGRYKWYWMKPVTLSLSEDV